MNDLPGEPAGTGAAPPSAPLLPMGVAAALSEGFRDLGRRRRLWPGLYLIGLGAALLVSWPIYRLLLGPLGHRPLLATELASGDLTVLGDLLGQLEAARPLVLWLLGLSLAGVYAAKVLLLGGVIEALGRGDCSDCLSYRDFGAAVGEHAAPLAKLAGLFLVLYGLGGALGALAIKLADLLSEGALWPPAPELALVVALAPVGLFVLGLATAHDYARLLTVGAADAGGPVRTVAAAGEAVRFVLAHPRALLLHAGSMASGLLLGLLLLGVTAPLGPTGRAALVALLLRQATSFGRTGVHLARYRSALVFFRSRRPSPGGQTAPGGAPAQDLVTM